MQCPACGADVAASAAVCSSCSAPLPALAPGTILAGRYEIQELLGAGALGRVYRALDRTLNEAVAVKVLHPETTRSAEITRRFRNEIKLARRVRHVNVCAIHEYGEEGPLQFVAMELVDGADLQRVLREKGPLAPAEVFEVALQVVRGLAAIHDAGVIHRDLKTSNIVRDPGGAVRLLDFGIAKRRTPTGTLALTNVERVVGTPEYMSPEQIRGDDLDPRSDIYSFGVVLFELCTGTLPFVGRTPLDTMLRQVNEPPPLYGDRAARIPPTLVPLLRRVLAKDPGGRPGSARELEAELLFAAVPDPPAWQAGAPDALPGSSSPPPPPLRAPARPPPPLTPPPVAPPPLPPASEARGGPERVDRTEVLPRRPGAPRPTPPPPPVVAARDAAAAAALDNERTYVELPAAPSSAGPALHPPPLPARATGLQPPPLPRPGRPAWLVPAGSALAALLLVLAVASWLTPGKEDVAPEATATPTPEANAPAVEAPAPPALASAAPGPKLLPPAPKSPPTPTPARPSSRPPTPLPSPEATPTPAPTPVPTPTPVRHALLAIGVRPWASVEIDGKPYGRTPLPGITVEPGEHAVELVNPEYWPRRRQVVLLPGSTLTLDIDLTWEAVRRSPTFPGRLPQGAAPPDSELDRGEDQLREMEWSDAIITLAAVVRRLKGQPRQRGSLARAYFYLGVAHLELEETSTARARFLAALEQDGKLRPPPAAFSPRVLGFFNHVRNTVKEK